MTFDASQAYVAGDSGSVLDMMSKAMDSYPPGFDGNPLGLLFLEDAHPIESAVEYLNHLDSPTLCDERREYLRCQPRYWPFPVFHLDARPDPLLLSDKLYRCFDAAERLLPTQRDVGIILAERARNVQPDIVALMIVDGLSYYDLPDTSDLQPCLVNGPSITEFGYREVVGKPSVSQRLFSLGYCDQLGFTYFDVESNALAGELYEVFGSHQVVRIRTFEECLDCLQSHHMSHGFVQISAPGLDGIVHEHHDRPPIAHYIGETLNRFDALIESLQRGHRTVIACLLADHGILWRENLDGQSCIVDDLLPDDRRHVRFINGSRLRSYARVRSCLDGAYSLMAFPFISRALRNNEWGVHGGISAWESIVPLLIRAV